MDTNLSLFKPPASSSVEELRGRLAALETLIARAPVPIAIAHDAQCSFISANAALARLLGVADRANISMTPPPGEEPAYTITRNGEPIPADELPMQYAIAHRTHVRNDIEIVRRDGTTLYVQNDVEPLYDAGGRVIGCVSVIVDFTARKYTEDLLREADQRKDEFLATLSHELRNPLAPIRNALEVMRRAPDPQTTERARAIMERQLSQLVRLTDDLLDVSRITRNRMDLRRERIDIRVPLQAALETTQPLIDAAGHTLEFDVPDQPLWVHADETRLAQAFGNLLNNAAKYTNRGGRISLRATVLDSQVTVTVTDTGIGIPPDLLPRIFEMFMQAEHTPDRSRGGLGIGLSLAKRLIELHGGSIDVRSGSTGTTFVARLPLASGMPERIPGKTTVRRRTASRRVLIAEDVPDAAEMLRMMLESMGHTVRIAADGVQAVSVAAEFKPHVALLDLGMPRMDGFEAARQIRTMLGNRVLLVALSGWGQDEDKRRASDAGFDHHLVKPADPERLEELIALGPAR